MAKNYQNSLATENIRCEAVGHGSGRSLYRNVMAEEEWVECPNCHRGVEPQLWLIGGDLLTYKRTQHLCPFCGVVMYETGGGYKRGPSIAAAVFALLVMVITALLIAWIYSRH